MALQLDGPSLSFSNSLLTPAPVFRPPALRRTMPTMIVSRWDYGAVCEEEGIEILRIKPEIEARRRCWELESKSDEEDTSTSSSSSSSAGSASSGGSGGSGSSGGSSHDAPMVIYR